MRLYFKEETKKRQETLQRPFFQVEFYVEPELQLLPVAYYLTLFIYLLLILPSCCKIFRSKLFQLDQKAS